MSEEKQPPEQRVSYWQTELIIQPSAIQLGHYVIRLDIPWINTPFPLQGVHVKDLKTRRWFIDNCQWVVVDVSKSSCDAELSDDGDQADQVYRALENDPTHPINSLRGAKLDDESVGASLKAYSLLDGQARYLMKRLSGTWASRGEGGRKGGW